MSVEWLDPSELVWAGPASLLLPAAGAILAHAPPVKPTLTADCSGLGEEKCGRGGCCDGWHDYHCMPLQERCEYAPSVGAARDAGKD